MSWTDRLPSGAWLSPESSLARHRARSRVLWIHVVALSAWAAGTQLLASGHSSVRVLLLPLLPAALALGARAFSALAGSAQLVTLGLIASFFFSIQLSHGALSANLHLFAVLVFAALYEKWSPLLFTIVAVVLYNAVLGLIAPGGSSGCP